MHLNVKCMNVCTNLYPTDACIVGSRARPMSYVLRRIDIIYNNMKIQIGYTMADTTDIDVACWCGFIYRGFTHISRSSRPYSAFKIRSYELGTEKFGLPKAAVPSEPEDNEEGEPNSRQQPCHPHAISACTIRASLGLASRFKEESQEGDVRLVQLQRRYHLPFCSPVPQ